jgi:hypothetical protein
MALDNRHQDKSGPVERKKNNIRVDTLREEYGERFALKFCADMHLGTLKERIGLNCLSSESFDLSKLLANRNPVIPAERRLPPSTFF